MTGVVEATEDAFHKHPALVIGCLIGVVLIGYVLTRSSNSNVNPVGNVSYSLGPSDSAIQAGAAIQIAQIQANAATAQTQASDAAGVSIAGLSANVSMNASNNGVSEAQLVASTQQQAQMYAYQAVVSNNGTTSHVSDNETELGINGQNSSAGVQIQQAFLTAQTAQNKDNLTAQTTQQLQDQNHDLNQQVIARNAATVGSLIGVAANSDADTNSELWSAIQSGQPQYTLDELRQQQAGTQGAIQGMSSNLFQSFYGATG